MINIVPLSIQKVSLEGKKLAQEFEKKYQCSPDAVVFIAKGGYLIGQAVAEYFNIPFVEIKAQRSGGSIKKLLSPFVKCFPSSVKSFLRSQELRMGIHTKKMERNISFDERQIPSDAHWKKIFLVDDSIDTGHTIQACVDYLKLKFPYAVIYTGGLNVWRQSFSVLAIDCALMYDTALQGPWSVDSLEYATYIKMYNTWVKGRQMNG